MFLAEAPDTQLWPSEAEPGTRFAYGVLVANLGHGHPEVNAAISDQLAQVACGYRYLYTSERRHD